ncbi:Ribosomal protein L18ae family [Prunus dulcis]|uniref:Ribosomal protein L18ae family n=1 Tax=Prunus dulcis TaxID=3755 RepID=A0A4Y1RSG2_PRUDU|nr:Ribosomal protein L18ae family [Prunus dulcis]
MHESSTGMTEAPFSNEKNDTEITVKEQYGGDSDDKEIVQLQIEGRGLSLVDGTYDKPLACFGCGIGWFSPQRATWPCSICDCNATKFLPEKQRT